MGQLAGVKGVNQQRGLNTTMDPVLKISPMSVVEVCCFKGCVRMSIEAEVCFPHVSVSNRLEKSRIGHQRGGNIAV